MAKRSGCEVQVQPRVDPFEGVREPPDVIAEVSVTGTHVILNLGRPPPEHLQDPATGQPLPSAAYLLSTRQGNGFYTGIGNATLLWLDSKPDDDAEEMGWVQGWNVAEWYDTGPAPVIGDSVPFVLDLQPSEHPTLSGTTYEPVGPWRRLALVPAVVLTDLVQVAGFIADVPATEVWSFTGEGFPPEDHFAIARLRSGDQLRYAAEIPMLYADVDSSGSLTPADALEGRACFAALVWVDPASDLEAAMKAHWFGNGTGWNAVDWIDEEPEGPLSEEGARDVVICDRWPFP